MRRGRGRQPTIGGVLAVVGERQLSYARLAVELGVGADAVEPIVEQLVGAGLLRRVTKDGEPGVALSAAGRQRLAQSRAAETPAPVVPTAAITDAICVELRRGRSFDDACSACGIRPGMGRRWLAGGLRRDRRSHALAGFAEAVTRARVDAAVRLADALSRALESDWRAAAGVLRAHEHGESPPLTLDDDDDVATAPPTRGLADDE